MLSLPQRLQKVIAELSSLPSLGPRQATRLAFYLLEKGPAGIRNASEALQALAEVKICERCYFVHENEGALCPICANSNRRADTVLVVEKETDLLSLENTGKYSGRYLVFGPIAKNGLLTAEQKNRLQRFKDTARREHPEGLMEIILGFNPSTGGDFHADLVARELAGVAQKMSRLGRGLPTGGEIEFADDETLGQALEGRK